MKKVVPAPRIVGERLQIICFDEALEPLRGSRQVPRLALVELERVADEDEVQPCAIRFELMLSQAHAGEDDACKDDPRERRGDEEADQERNRTAPTRCMPTNLERRHEPVTFQGACQGWRRPHRLSSIPRVPK